MSQFVDYSGWHHDNSDGELIFDEAVKIHGRGSTCDIYRTRWQCREIFIKRLKPELATKPVYLDALKKEFEIGAVLNHPSLPYYREFHDNYIILDYIDGVTLADMITNHDRWLADETNIVKLLRQLVDAVDYLHRHNVVHCDIKPDNIMITANGKNLILIDFDKCYTDALNDTPGHPGKFGLSVEYAGNMKVDFYGMANVLDAIMENDQRVKFKKYKQFIKACRSEDVSCQELLNMLYIPRRWHTWWWITGVVMVVFIATVVYLRQPHPTRESVNPINSIDSVQSNQLEQPEILDVAEDAIAPEPFTQAALHANAQSKAQMLDRQVEESFALLHSSLDRLEAMRADSTMSRREFIDALRRHSDLEDETITEAFATLNETFPGTTEREAWRIMAYSKAYTTYKRRMTAFENSLR